jgi:4-hydroxybenzoate polyprenyltransferase
MIYVRSTNARNFDERTLWYRHNLAGIRLIITFTLWLVAAFLIYLLWKNRLALISYTLLHWALILVFPAIAALYTFKIPGLYFKKIRQIGWLKPFIVGLTWSGWVTVYPVLVWQAQRGYINKSSARLSWLFWLQNFLFISILAIIFDIKDYRNDVRFQLKTYPATLGVRNTFWYVVYPVTIVNIIIFLLFQFQHDFSVWQTVVQSIPYLLLVWVLLTYRKTRSVLYYLVAIDGLMFLKAICGIISITFLNRT